MSASAMGPMTAASTPQSDPSKKPRRSGEPRRPSRERGVARFRLLLDATEALLLRQNPDAIGLYQIAEEAGMPPASVYHFFPTKEAAYQALAERYLAELIQIHEAPVEARLLQGWQDVLAIDIRRTVDFYNSHPAALKVFYGGFGGVEARAIDISFTETMAAGWYNRLDWLFYMPFLRDPLRHSLVAIGIFDAICGISVRRHGHITEEYVAELLQAGDAYHRLYLPPFVERRAELLAAEERGASVSLPYSRAAAGNPAEIESAALA